MTIIEKVLRDHGPMLSGDLIRVLDELTPTAIPAIRQQISRAKEPIKKVNGIFRYNQSLLYLEEHITEGQYMDVLKSALRESATRVYTLIKALEFHRGYMKEEQLPAYMFSPTANLLGHKRADMVLKDAARLNLIQRGQDLVYLNSTYFPDTTIDLHQFKAVEMARNFILSQFADWAKMMGMVSFDSTKLFNEYAKFQWAFTGPSYVASLAQFSKTGIKPAFLIADILIGKKVKEDDVLFFIEKIKVLKALKSSPRIIPFLIVDNVSSETLQLLKKEGIVIGFVEKLFGRGYSDLIRTLINTVSNAGAILKKNPAEFLALMNKINVLVDGKTNNLRGDVFELSVGYYHSRLCKNLDISKVLYINGLQREFDVFAVYSDCVKVCECKGMKRAVTLSEIEEWLDKITLLRTWFRDQDTYHDKRQVFEYWSTGGFTEEAKNKLALAAKAKKFEILYFEEADILKKAKEIKGAKFVDILKQYFIKESV